MDFRLIITNIGYAISIATTIGLALFTFIRSTRKELRTTYFLLSIALTVFMVSHVLGINFSDPVTSRAYFMWNLSNIFIVAFNAHFIFAALGISRQRMTQLIEIYALGIALFIFYLWNPYSFLQPSVPKLYLPSYYEPGPWYWLMLLYFAIVIIYAISHLVVAMLKTDDPIVRGRCRFYITGHIIAYAFGITAHFLSYDFPIDPIWSMFIGLYAVFFTYAILKYELLDITIVAKRAFTYSLLIIAGGLIINFVSFSNTWIVTRVPNFHPWIIPLISSAAVVAFGAFAWKKIREVDTLKYEFINVVTHKFRTPLTYVKWSTDTLHNEKAREEEKRVAIEQIENANVRLVELTNILIDASNAENKNYVYDLKQIQFDTLVKDIFDRTQARFSAKQLDAHIAIEPHLPVIMADQKRIEFAIQILLDNAFTYTPKNGSINVFVKTDGKYVVLEVADSGIGIAREDLPYIFNKFYRSHSATLADTEGMGVGLFIAKNIIVRHKGKISAKSDGHDKGSTFFVKLPVIK